MSQKTRRVVRAAGVLLFLLLALCLVTAFVGAPGTFDDYAFIQWGKTLNALGPFAGYEMLRHDTELDYPPLGVFIMWLSLCVGHEFGASELLSFKVPLAFCSFAGGVIALLRRGRPVDGVLLMLVVTPFGLVLGYTDVVYLPFLLLALYTGAEDRFLLGGAALTVAALIKWQPIILAPAFLMAAFATAGDLKRFGLVLFPSAAIVVVVLALFGPATCVEVFLTATRDEYLSGQGANVGWLISYVLETLHVGGLLLQPNGDVAILQITAGVPAIAAAMAVLRVMFYSFFVLTLVIYAVGEKSRPAFLLTVLGCCLVQFTWNSGVHENHLFPAMIVAFVAWQAGAIDGFLCLCVALIGCLNVVLFYGFGDGFNFGFYPVDATVLLSAAEVLLFGLVFFVQMKACLGAGDRSMPGRAVLSRV